MMNDSKKRKRDLCSCNHASWLGERDDYTPYDYVPRSRLQSRREVLLLKRRTESVTQHSITLAARLFNLSKE